jgi:ABC-type transport system involved in cytochrome c biogenesis permease component
VAVGAAAGITTLAFDGAAGGPLILGLPPGEFVAVILAPLAILVATFAFTAHQQALDRRHDVAEE